MGLIVPRGPSWRACTSNVTSAGIVPDAIDELGVFVEAHATNANEDGDPVTILDDLAHDCEYLIVGVLNEDGNNAAGWKGLVDILYDPAGGTSWQELVPDLLADWVAQNGADLETFHVYFFPLWVPAGSSLGARVRSTGTGRDYRVIVHAFGDNENPGSWWCGQKVTAVGVNPATSSGTDHTPGTSDSFSAWANLGSALSQRCGALQFAVQGSDSTSVLTEYFFEFGAADQRIGFPIYMNMTNSEVALRWPTGPVFKALGAGTQLQVRAACSSASSEAIDVAAYAVS